MQTITLEDVKRKGREFYEAGRLTAQHPDPEQRKCTYETNDGYRCVVGAAMTDETLQQLALYGHLYDVIDTIDNEVLIIESDDLDDIIFLQKVHDDWAEATPDRYSQLEERFKELLYS